MAKKIWPFDVVAFDESERVKALTKDYQRYWYLRLCVAAYSNPVRPGCVSEALCDLWKQAGVTAEPPRSLTLNPMRQLELEFAQVLALFVPTGDGWLRHERVSQDVNKKQHVSNVRRLAKKGGTTIVQQLLKRDIDLDSSLITEIYKAYPRKKKPKEARRAIRKAIGELVKGLTVAWRDHEGRAYLQDIKCFEDAAAYLLEAVKQYRDSPEGQNSKEFVPYPATWFNAESYLEDRAEWYAGGKDDGAQKPRAGQQREAGIVERAQKAAAILGNPGGIASGDAGRDDSGGAGALGQGTRLLRN